MSLAMYQRALRNVLEPKGDLSLLSLRHRSGLPAHVPTKMAICKHANTFYKRPTDKVPGPPAHRGEGSFGTCVRCCPDKSRGALPVVTACVAIAPFRERVVSGLTVDGVKN
jgi:hypothetical protein